MAKTIDIKLLLRLTLKKWFLFVAVALLSLFVALVLTAEVQPDVYQATTSLSSIVEGSTTDSLNGFRLLVYYSGLINSSKIATDAREILPDSLDVTARQIQYMIGTSFSDVSNMLYITSSSSDSQLALNVANAVAEAFVAEISNITGDDTIKIYDRAINATRTYDGRSEQQKTRITIPVVSLFLLLLIVFIWALFSDRIKSVSEAALDGKVQVIGIIPRF